MVIKHYSGTNTPKPRFLIIFDYSEWSKNYRVFSLYMQDYGIDLRCYLSYHAQAGQNYDVDVMLTSDTHGRSLKT